jgi:23S rRNA (guanosine2251-2'-O)-methyltransferase
MTSYLNNNKNINSNKKIIYGISTVIRTIEYGHKYINYILVKRKFINQKINNIIYLANKFNLPIKYVDSRIINSIIPNTRKQDVLCYINNIPFYKVINLLPKCSKNKPLLVLILDNILDVRNLGAIIRSAFFFGVSFVVIPFNINITINMDLVKTSSGFIFKVPVCRENNISNIIKILSKFGFTIFSANEKSHFSIYNYKFNMSTAIILGNEGVGISNKYLLQSDFDFRIPCLQEYKSMKHLSLNVSVACGVVLYEIMRQRKTD